MIQGMGTKLKIGANSIAELTEIGGLELSADTIESTTLDSGGWRNFIQGMKDAGEVSLSGYFNPADTNGQKALYDAFNNGSVLAYVILFPVAMGAEWDFNAVVTGFKTGVAMEDGISFEATLKVTGQPSLGITASGGLTALTVTGAGGTLTPSFANGTYFYTYSGVTATSITVTATAASHTLQLFVNGSLFQTLTSGAASNAISLPSIGSVADIAIIAQESGKSQKIYEIRAVKTA